MVKATPLDKVVEALKVRCSWPLMRQILAASDLKPGAGWDDLIAKGVRGDASGNSIAELVRDTYLEIVYAGDRIIQLYDVDERGCPEFCVNGVSVKSWASSLQTG